MWVKVGEDKGKVSIGRLRMCRSKWGSVAQGLGMKVKVRVRGSRSQM